MLGAVAKENGYIIITKHVSIYNTKIIPIIYLNQNVIGDKILKTGDVRNHQFSIFVCIKVTIMIFFIRFKVWVVVITKYEKKQAILVDFRFFLMRMIITLPIIWKYSIDIPAIMMASLISTIPMILIYLFGQKHFVRGIYSGAIKE